MSSIVLAASLKELDNETPYSYEKIRREYLWKHYLYGAIGMHHAGDINNALSEMYMYCTKHEIGFGSSISLILLNPSYKPRLVIHKYQDEIIDSVEYLLKGTNEHIIDPRALEEAHKYAMHELRVELNNTYYKS